ncbi:SDR family NAD(P)-dependent oxidoreductase [Lentzea flava]|uniref:Short chain dehydrogenase n=1 Tax=Lentzea flava TaxID=103732 RepID=A0ABQ2UV75_9PSEU|nr:SDR family NAD(P)-dependent oxidoreductase [Lentzea flava]MCP2200792.1 short chain dehydrogenase [Lentzea flava]GGU55614.1 hypothetical protein GCM10010178_55140 [Lentzea flava]
MTSRVWFVTGADRRIGRAYTKAALAAGDRVVGAARDVSRLDDLAAVYPGRLLALSLDVTDRPAVFAAVDEAVARFGRLDVVVNDAGALFTGMMQQLTGAADRARQDLNFFGAPWVGQAALPLLRAQGSGHIVQISTIGAGTEAPQVRVRLTIVQPGGGWTDLYASNTTTSAIDSAPRAAVRVS